VACGARGRAQRPRHPLDRLLRDRPAAVFRVRGRIVIPIVGHNDPFIWGCWASVSRDGFERFGKLWDAPVRDHEPPLPAQLANDNPIYPATLGLACNVVMKNARRRPSFDIQPADHPLAVEQRNGITLDRIKEIASRVLRHSREG
jgi:hypothetical protein